jgi:redox-sensitive bicupin YhaK (pirin superfamily)
MKTLRAAADRGHTQIGWLDSQHTFSFGEYHDPAAMGFRVLRVINDDRVAAGAGFPTHGHRDMEILTYVLEGGLNHRDSLGTGSVISPGDLQRMSAGRGVRHSEWNASAEAPVHFLQIWILPDQPNVAPSYEQKTFPEAERRGRLRLVASPDGQDGSLTIHQDARLLVGVLSAGQQARYDLRPGRFGYIHVARGSASLDGETLSAGDGMALTEESTITLAGAGSADAEVLLFDLP